MELRKAMVEKQLKARGILDESVLNTFLKIPREVFVLEEYQGQSYEDTPLPIGYDQTISQPYTVACMTELLELEPEHTVLEIGTGSGYQAAILSELAEQVYSIERIPELAEMAKKALRPYKNVTVITGDGSKGYPEHSPYDRIIVTAGADTVPQPLIDQLNDPGILVIPKGPRPAQEMLRIKKIDGVTSQESHGLFSFVPLIREN